jgi:hypothetical protein
MKKLSLIVAVMIAALASIGGPNTKVNAEAERNAGISIKEQISFPDFLREREGKHSATVSFSVTGCGTLIVRDIKCDESDLKEDLLDQLRNIKINNWGLDTKSTYKVVVIFQTL